MIAAYERADLLSKTYYNYTDSWLLAIFSHLACFLMN